MFRSNWHPLKDAKQAMLIMPIANVVDALVSLRFRINTAVQILAATTKTGPNIRPNPSTPDRKDHTGGLIKRIARDFNPE
jgi:hypothetical protein